ncbi:hypothetical protein RCH21_002246 [Arthrobacter sp. PL16]|nr:hypothetical protein [Arthrobacter sp. PL16]
MLRPADLRHGGRRQNGIRLHHARCDPRAGGRNRCGRSTCAARWCAPLAKRTGIARDARSRWSCPTSLRPDRRSGIACLLQTRRPNHRAKPRRVVARRAPHPYRGPDDRTSAGLTGRYRVPRYRCAVHPDRHRDPGSNAHHVLTPDGHAGIRPGQAAQSAPPGLRSADHQTCPSTRASLRGDQHRGYLTGPSKANGRRPGVLRYSCR